MTKSRGRRTSPYRKQKNKIETPRRRKETRRDKSSFGFLKHEQAGNDKSQLDWRGGDPGISGKKLPRFGADRGHGAGSRRPASAGLRGSRCWKSQGNQSTRELAEQAVGVHDRQPIESADVDRAYPCSRRGVFESSVCCGLMSGSRLVDDAEQCRWSIDYVLNEKCKCNRYGCSEPADA